MCYNMGKFAVVLLMVLIYFEDNVLAKGLPSFLKLCHRNDVDINTCIEKNIEMLRPKLKNGIKDLYLPSLNPLRIEKVSLDSGNNFKATFKDLQFWNTDNFKINKIDLDLDQYKFDINITFPLLRIMSIYNLDGRILILNLNGQGPADGNYSNVEAALSLKGSPFKKNNRDHLKWDRDSFSLKIGKTHIYFENLFGDNQELTDRTNQVINENIEAIIDELKPVIKQVISDFVFTIVNRIFLRYSVDELFPK